MSDHLDEEFKEVAAKINAKLAEAAAALREANVLKDRVGLDMLFQGAYSTDGMSRAKADKFLAMVKEIDVEDLEAQISDAGWSTSSSYC